MGIQLILKVCGLDDAGDFHEHRVVCASLSYKRGKGTAPVLILVRVSRTRSVETVCAALALNFRDLFCGNEDQFSIRVNESPNQPCRGGAIDPNFLARDPFHRLPPFEAPIGSW